MRGPAILLALSCAAPLPSFAADLAPDVVARFYDTYQKAKIEGLPTAEQQKRLAPFLSKRLLAAMDKARVEQDRFIKEHPDEKPPWIEGSLVVSPFEGYQTFRVVRSAGQPAGETKVVVRFSFPGAKDWEDTAVVRVENGAPVIDEILFAGAGDFNPPGTLSDRLKPTQ